MNLRKISFFAPIMSLFLITIILAACNDTTTTTGKYDEFATCLGEKGLKMYGAYWCGACNYQKQMFGESASKLPYVECSLPEKAGQTKICYDEEIQAYPTWEFPDGEKKTGVRSFEDLAAISGCEAPKVEE